MTSTTTWECPNCKHKFAKSNQAHTCSAFSLEDHLLNKSPGAKILFEIILEKIKAFGKVLIIPVKTSVTFVSGFTFAIIQIQQAALKLEFVSPKEIRDK